MSCQRVLDANNQVWKTCLILHQQMKTPELRDEYLTLAYFVQGLYLIFGNFVGSKYCRFESGVQCNRILDGKPNKFIHTILFSDDLFDYNYSVQYDFR